MRIRHALASLTVILAGAACSGVPFAPKWNVDVYFPLRYPDVALQQYTMVIPPSNVSFTTAMDSDVVSSGTRQILDEDIDSLKADVIFSTQTNIAGTLDVSIAPAKANLFSVNPALALTVTIPLRVTAGDTSHVTVNIGLFKQANVLYTQSRATVRSNSGFLTVGPSDKLTLRVDLTANVKLSK